MITAVSGTCQYEGCGLPATCIASGYFDNKGHETGCYCDHHAYLVADEGGTEYIVTCPNCTCQFGVG